MACVVLCLYIALYNEMQTGAFRRHYCNTLAKCRYLLLLSLLIDNTTYYR